MTKRRTLAVTAAGVAVVGYGTFQRRARSRGAGAVLRRSFRRARMADQPPSDELFDLPADVVHLTVPTTDGGSLHIVDHGPGIGLDQP